MLRVYISPVRDVHYLFPLFVLILRLYFLIRKSEAAQDDANSYNPWTSQAPFTLIRPVKEINTNYTMTYSKATVRHMSVIDHLDCNIKGRPMGTHELSEFKKMSMQDLENTLQKVCIH